MRVEDMLLFVPRKMRAFVGKMRRFELDERVKNEIMTQGLYHFTPNEEVADQILKTEYLKPSNHRVSNGKPCAFMYCGMPDIDNYSKNIKIFKISMNPYVNPTMVADAIKFLPRVEDLKNYEIRALADNAVMCEGHCILPHQQVQKVKMVPDLVRDLEGHAIRGKNGELSVEFREATPEDQISPDGKSYVAKDDYLEYMRKRAQELGYRQDGSFVGNLINGVVDFIDRGRMDSVVRKSIEQKNRTNGFNKKLKGKKQICPQTVEEALQTFSFKRKNPYYYKEFALFVARVQTEEEKTQLDLAEVLPEFTASKSGEYFFRKYNDLTDVITKTGIHGKDHSERVGLLAMMMAEREGIFEDDKDNRIRDILATAAMYHDLGRVLDAGPHAKNSVRKLRKMDLRFADGRPYTTDDKNLVFALVDAHEGLPDKIESMIELYGITNPDDVKLAFRLSSIVRDADALDRVRTDINLGIYKTDINFGIYKTDLKPKYLVNTTAKQFVILAYQLEHVKKHIKDMRQILGYKTDYEERQGDESKNILPNIWYRYTVKETPTIQSNKKDLPQHGNGERVDRSGGTLDDNFVK